MKAPLRWFLYINYPPADGNWAAAMQVLKSDLSETGLAETEAFLRAAQTASEGDLYVIHSEELDIELYLEPEEGHSIRSVWAEHLRDFIA